ncbi:MAG: carboxypeptidase-like regulatory domain-containing protein [Thermoanaerobaculia bacterium]
MILSGRGRDTFTAGPLEQGVYRLAVRPGGFDRWTWSFETHDPRDATDFQVDTADGDGVGTVDLGLFQLECGPTVDLLPSIADGADFPDLEEIEVEVRLLDPESGDENQRPPSVLHRDGRLRLRNFPRQTPPRGAPLRRPPLLEITLVHPHLLPAPVQRWQTDLELERGRFEEIELQVEALGGAVAIEGEGAMARLFGPAEEIREVLFVDGKAEIPSLAPGRYSLRIEDRAGQLLKAWNDLEVSAGQTLRLENRP